jgi:hypothetical protein
MIADPLFKRGQTGRGKGVNRGPEWLLEPCVGPLHFPVDPRFETKNTISKIYTLGRILSESHASIVMSGFLITL